MIGILKESVRIPLEHLAQQFMEVSQCWQDPKRAIRRGMSVEKALFILRRVHTRSIYHSNGLHLAKRADLLLQEIILKQAGPEVPEVNIVAAIAELVER